MLTAALSLTICATYAFGDTFAERLDYGNAQLRSGDIEGALSTYQDLQVDEPESGILYYSNGSAKYQEGLDHMALQAPEDAGTAFEEAKESFLKASTSEDGALRTDGAYNHANTVAQTAKLAMAQGDHEATVKGFEDSVQAYEQFLRGHPGHEAATHNLAHMRYLLKKMLQNPPPPPEESEDQEEQEGDKQEEQEDEQKQDQEKQEDQEEQKENEEQEEQDPQEPEDEKEQQEQESQAEAGEQEPNEEDRQNIEAILQSLEEQDKREQQETHRARPESRRRVKWW